MFKRIIEPAARTRIMLPLVVSFALLGVVITETTYRGAKATLESAIALTDARIQSAALLQSLSNHEIATQLYLLTNGTAQAEQQQETGQAVRRIEQQAFEMMRIP